MSDTSVHPLIAESEYARLMRNMSIEYGLLLLTKLEKNGTDLAMSAVTQKPPLQQLRSCKGLCSVRRALGSELGP